MLFNLWRSTTFILIFFSLDIVVVILFTNIIGLIYSFWNYIREVLILWTNLLSPYQKMKDLYKNCRSYEVTQLCRWKLLHLNLFSGSKLDLKNIFVECQIFDTRHSANSALPSVLYLAHGKWCVCRVPIFCRVFFSRHTTNKKAHGKLTFSGSVWSKLQLWYHLDDIIKIDWLPPMCNYVI